MTALYALAVVLVVVLVPLKSVGFVLIFMFMKSWWFMIRKQNKLEIIWDIAIAMGFVITTLMWISPSIPLLHLHHLQLNSYELLHHLSDLSFTSKFLFIDFVTTFIDTIDYYYLYYNTHSPLHLSIHYYSLTAIAPASILIKTLIPVFISNLFVTRKGELWLFPFCCCCCCRCCHSFNSSICRI